MSELQGQKDDYDFIESVTFDGSISTDSIFPEWIHSEELEFEKLTSGRLPARKFYNIIKQEGNIDEYFTAEYGFPDNISEVAEYFDNVDKAWEDRTHAFYSIFHAETNEFMGQATIENASFDTGKAEIGVWLRKEYWGQGYSQKRAEMLCEAIFTALDLSVIEITVATDNMKSIKAVEKYMRAFGGKYDGELRKETLTPDNGIQDVYKWSLTADEFYSPDATYSRNNSLPTFEE